LWISVLFTVPLLVITMGELVPPIANLLMSLSMRTRVLVELALAAPVCTWGALPFFVRAVDSIRNRSLNMFTLIGLGVSVAFGYSLVAALFPGVFPESFREHGEVATYFEAASAI